MCVWHIVSAQQIVLEFGFHGELSGWSRTVMENSSSFWSQGDPGPLRQLLWLKRSIPVFRQPEVPWEGKFSTWTLFTQ